MAEKFKQDITNFAASDKWRLMIGDLTLLTRGIHDFSIPGVYSEGTDGPSPGNVLLAISSERLTYDPVVFTFVLDEQWKNWETCFGWIVDNSNQDEPSTRDIIIDLLDNTNRSIGLTITLISARPSALDNVLLDVDAEVPQLVCTVTFKYQEVQISRSSTSISS